MLSTYTIWDQLWSALVTTLAKIVWTLLKAENRHTSQKKWNSAGCQSPGTLLLLPSTFFRLFLRFLPCFPMAAVFTYFRLYLVAAICHTSPECHSVTQLRVVTTPASQELRAAAAGQRSLPGPPEDITLSRDRGAIYLVIYRPTPCL